MTIAITGYAWRTPLGNTIDGAIRRLLAGERALQRNTRFPIGGYACKVAAMINDDPAPSSYQRFLRRMGLYAREAALQAYTAAAPTVAENRLGLFFGYGGLRAHWNDLMPGLAEQRSDFSSSWERGFKRFHPFWMLQNLSNNAHAIVAKELHARGDGLTFGGANAGAQALVGAIRSLKAGACDVACVAAYDTLLEPETLVEMAARGVVATDVEAPAAYSLEASGFVPGEAAAALVLERAENAAGQMLARIEARDTADGSADAPSVTTLESLLLGFTQPEDVIDGAARCDRAFDQRELAVLGSYLPGAALISTLGAMGQVGAAASLLQAIALTELLRRGVLSPVAALTKECASAVRPILKAEPTTARSAIGLSVGPPGLAGAVRLQLP